MAFWVAETLCSPLLDCKKKVYSSILGSAPCSSESSLSVPLLLCRIFLPVPLPAPPCCHRSVSPPGSCSRVRAVFPSPQGQRDSLPSFLKEYDISAQTAEITIHHREPSGRRRSQCIDYWRVTVDDQFEAAVKCSIRMHWLRYLY